MLVRSPPPPFPISLRPRPHHRLRPDPTPDPVPVPVSILAPDFDPPPTPFTPSRSSHPVAPSGTMRLYRHRALRMRLSGARKRHSLSAEMMMRVEYKCLLYNKKNRRRRHATSVPSARCWDSWDCVSHLCSTRLMASSLMKALTSEPTSPYVDIAKGRRE